MMKLQTKIKTLLFSSLIAITLFACDASGGAPQPPVATEPPLLPAGAEEIQPTDVAEVVAPTEVVDVATQPPTATLPPPTITPTSGPTHTLIPFTAFLFGRVYHDTCINDASQHLKTSDIDTCVLQSDGSLLANAAWDESDQGLFGVTIDLYYGACPSTELVAKASTNGEGFYVFPNLPPGDYCVKMDVENWPNVGLTPNWFPGQFTLPANGTYSITLEPDQQLSDIDFAWDYTALPQPEKACFDKATLVNSEAGDTAKYIGTGLAFEKSWEVRNDGTCTWTTNYQVKFILGEQMTAADSFNLEKSVAPGDVATITHAFTAPTDRGIYIGAWEIVNELGELVPLGEKGGDKLTLEVNVSPGIVTTAYGPPHWFDDFNNRDYWNPAAGPNASFEITEGRMLMTSHRTDGFDSWILSAPDVANGYIEASFTTGSHCAGYDRYGLIVRSDIKSGYFIGITCDGQWSIRKWNGKQWTVYTGWQSSDAIRTGNSQGNVIGAYLDEDVITIYINGTKIYSAQLDGKYYHSGRYGVFIAGQNTAELEIYVEEMGMWSFP